MTTAERIAPIIFETYGQSDFIQAMVDDVAKKIDEPRAGEVDRGLEHTIMITCWNWMAGGGTAEIVAKRIMEVLGDE